ncbi:MAG: tetratricopeptide repeat protein [Devosia sp.]
MSSDTLIREVDDELRRDQIRKLWRRVMPWVIGGAILIVVGVAGYEGWTWWSKVQIAKASDQFYAAAQLADGKDPAAATKALDDLIAQNGGGYAMLARFREANLLAQQGQTDQAVATYDALSGSLDNTHLRELALVLAANLLIDKGDVEAVQQRVGGLVAASSPLRNAAREALGLTQYKAGKLDDAMTTFQAIIDDTQVNRDIQSRVGLYQQQMLAEGAKPIVSASAAAEAAVSALAAATSAEPSAPVASAPASTPAVSAAPSAASSSAP